MARTADFPWPQVRTCHGQKCGLSRGHGQAWDGGATVSRRRCFHHRRDYPRGGGGQSRCPVLAAWNRFKQPPPRPSLYRHQSKAAGCLARVFCDVRNQAGGDQNAGSACPVSRVGGRAGRHYARPPVGPLAGRSKCSRSASICHRSRLTPGRILHTGGAYGTPLSSDLA